MFTTVTASLEPWAIPVVGEEEDVARRGKFESGIAHDSTIVTLWLFNIAMEHGP